MSTSSPSDRSDAECRALIADHASQFRASLEGESRSATLTQLLDYLLDRSIDARPPKEIEIALDVFGKSAAFDTSQDSMVRGHVHRLRQRLDSFNVGKTGPRLQMPKGGYRLILSDEPEEEAPGEAPPLRVPTSPTPRSRAWLAITIALIASLLYWGTVYVLGDKRRTPSVLAETALWKPIAAAPRPPLIAAGDIYLVAQSGPEGKMRRLVMHSLIQSSRELDDYLTMHPDQYSKMHDRDIHRVPAVVATGAAAMLPLVSAMRPDRGVPDIVPASQLSQERIEASNIIYLEHFPQLGMLRSPILHRSGFAPGESFDELKDLATGTVFKARRAESARSPDAAQSAVQSYGYDYGYIASYPGPSGNQILVISGVDDIALAQMVKLVSDQRQLDVLARRTRGSRAFEALYRVRTVGDRILDTKLLIARPLKSDTSRD